MFLDREQELRWLAERYESGQAEFIVLTGRRRVGKTALLTEFTADKPGVYFLAYLDSTEALRMWVEATFLSPPQQRYRQPRQHLQPQPQPRPHICQQPHPPSGSNQNQARDDILTQPHHPKNHQAHQR